MVRVLANSPGNQSLFPGQVIPMTKNKKKKKEKKKGGVLDAFLLNTQYYKVQIKGKWSNPGK